MALDRFAQKLLRREIIDLVTERALEKGSFTMDELRYFPLRSGEFYAVIDRGRGIRNPREFDATLSVVSALDGPYQDAPLTGALMRYDYRKGGPEGDNTKLRRAKETADPIILFIKPEANVYIPVVPVYVVADQPSEGYVLLAVDESARFMPDGGKQSEAQRRYVEILSKRRLHQPVFRGMVLRAYQTQCAVCRLRHGELLDAAHIIADRDELGRAAIPNGLSLCKIHHAAYDQNLLGISPDLQVHINRNLLDEVDGPMLRYGIQAMHGVSILQPSARRDRPDRELLKLRFGEFRNAG